MTTAAELTPLLLRIAEAQTADTVWKLATDYFRSLGFSRVNYGFTRFLQANSIGDPADAFFLTTADAAYANKYFNGGFYARTPVFKWAQRNVGACTWAWVRQSLERGELTADEVETLKQNAAMGVLAGITVSFPDPSSRAKGALGLIADIGITEAEVETIFQRSGLELQTVAQMMHLKLVQMPHSTQRRALTARQKEALEWVADGKTTQDVAILMSVSAAMIEKHLRLAREALDVDTTTQAVAKATLLNLIFQRKPELVE